MIIISTETNSRRPITAGRTVIRMMAAVESPGPGVRGGEVFKGEGGSRMRSGWQENS